VEIDEMRSALLILIAAVAAGAPVADVSGAWKLDFTRPHERPKMVTEIVLELTARGDEVTGVAHMGAWPGEAPLINGKLEGNRISFTVIGRHAWWSSGPMRNASGFPKLIFDGAVNGATMRLTLTWDNVTTHGIAPVVREYQLKGAKTSR
jgi:hypothetical protein